MNKLNTLMITVLPEINTDSQISKCEINLQSIFTLEFENENFGVGMNFTENKQDAFSLLCYFQVNTFSTVLFF